MNKTFSKHIVIYPSGIIIGVYFLIGTWKGPINNRENTCELKDSNGDISPSQSIIICEFFQGFCKGGYVFNINLFKSIVRDSIVIHNEVY